MDNNDIVVIITQHIQLSNHCFTPKTTIVVYVNHSWMFKKRKKNSVHIKFFILIKEKYINRYTERQWIPFHTICDFKR